MTEHPIVQKAIDKLTEAYKPIVEPVVWCTYCHDGHHEFCNERRAGGWKRWLECQCIHA